jgi:hypothetical protein
MTLTRSVQQPIAVDVHTIADHHLVHLACPEGRSLVAKNLVEAQIVALLVETFDGVGLGAGKCLLGARHEVVERARRDDRSHIAEPFDGRAGWRVDLDGRVEAQGRT